MIIEIEKGNICEKHLPKISLRLDELAKPKKVYLLSAFEQNLDRISIFQIENFLNVLYQCDHQTLDQAICTIMQNLNQMDKSIKRKKYQIEILNYLIHREQMKIVATQIESFINESKDFCIRLDKLQLNSKLTNLQDQINLRFCQFSDEHCNCNFKYVFNPVPQSQNKNIVGLFHVQEYSPLFQQIGPNHIGKTLLWHTVNSKYYCQQDLFYCDFNKFDDFIDKHRISSVSFDIETNLDATIKDNTEDTEIDSSMFEINKEDCEQLTQKGAAFQLDKTRLKEMETLKKKPKPNNWKCLLEPCNTPKWDVNWIDKTK